MVHFGKNNYQEWYWKFIPHYREVIDPEEQKKINEETNRPWYKIFDEYEYRYNKQTRSTKRSWSWFEKGSSKAEKKLRLKLDFLIIGYAIIGYWSKQLNVANVSNAYVSGMKEDLEMYGNELSNAVALYNAGSVIFQVFNMYLFPRVPIQLFFFSETFLWGITTLATANIQNVTHLYVSRFFIGAFVSIFFP